MNRIERVVTWVYEFLVACYPSPYQAEFSDEMQEVFATLLAESQPPNGKQYLRLLFRELRDWPSSVLKEHLRQGRKKMPSRSSMENESLPSKEMLASLTIFLLPFVGIFGALGIIFPQWIDISMLLLFWGAIIFTLGLAISKGLPSWSLPYFGIVLLPGVIFGLSPGISSRIYPLFIQIFGPREIWSLSTRIIYSGVIDFSMLILILLTASVFVFLLRIIPFTQSVWQRIREDWTKLSYLLYGGLVFYILLTFDEYQFEDAWRFVAWLCLAIGAWLYLRAKNRMRQILALIIGTWNLRIRNLPANTEFLIYTVDNVEGNLSTQSIVSTGSTPIATELQRTNSNSR